MERVLIVALGLVLMFAGIALFVIRGIVGAILSPLRPRVIIVQESALHERQSGFAGALLRAVFAIAGLAILAAILHTGQR